MENIDHAAFEEWLQIMDAEAGTLGTLPTGAGTSNPFDDVVAKSVVPVNLAPNQQRLKKRMLGPCTDYASFCAALSTASTAGMPTSEAHPGRCKQAPVALQPPSERADPLHTHPETWTSALLV